MYCKYKFVNTGNEEFFSTVNKELLDEIKSPSQLNKHNLANVTYIDFIVNYSTKNTVRRPGRE